MPTVSDQLSRSRSRSTPLSLCTAEPTFLPCLHPSFRRSPPSSAGHSSFARHGVAMHIAQAPLILDSLSHLRIAYGLWLPFPDPRLVRARAKIGLTTRTSMVNTRLRLQRLDLIHLKFGVVYTLCIFEFVQVRMVVIRCPYPRCGKKRASSDPLRKPTELVHYFLDWSRILITLKPVDRAYSTRRTSRLRDRQAGLNVSERDDKWS